VDLKYLSQTMLGAEVFTQRNFNGRLSATFSAGYPQNLAKKFYPSLTALPDGGTIMFQQQNFKFITLKAGMRTYAGRNFFYGGEVGLMMALNTRWYQQIVNADGSSDKSNIGRRPKAFIYGAGAGYSFENGLEAGFKFEAYTGTFIKQAYLRLGYRFKVN
jgi:hypothetical protein